MAGLFKLLSNREEMGRILADVKKETRGSGLLDLIPAREPDGQFSAPDEAKWTFDRRPTPQEIDYSQTTGDMILGCKAILKDGRRITWPHGDSR